MMLVISGALLALMLVALLGPKPKQNSLAEAPRRGWRNPFRRAPDPAKEVNRWVAEQFHATVQLTDPVHAEAAAEFVAWLGGTSAELNAAFVGTFLAFCDRTGVKVSWLWDPHVTAQQKRTAAEAAMLYCLAAWKGRETRALEAYLAWQAAPSKKENRAFAQRLYAELETLGVVTTPAALLAAPQKERQAHVAQALAQAEAEHYAVFVRLASELVK